MRHVLCASALLAALLTASAHGLAQPAAVSSEVRALWVTRSALNSPSAVAQMVQAAANGGFNTLVVQVRGRGDAYYRSGVEPRAADLASRPEFDPLAETLQRAKAAGLKVHAWVAINLVSSAVDLPASRQHLVYRHPEWLMVPKALAADLRRVDVRNPEYVNRLARWTRARPAEVEGLYASPLHPEAANHVIAVVTDIVSQYAVDGLHLDYVRFPNEEFDYSRGAIDLFKQSIRSQVTNADRRRLDAQEAADPAAYPSFYPEGWASFRQSRLTAMVVRLRTAIKAIKPDVILSAAVFPDPAQARDGKLQDWRGWLGQSLLDALCPMTYTQDLAIFEQQVAAAQQLAGAIPVWAGVGAYRLTSAGTLSHIAAARRLKAAGVILFSYDALVTSPNSAATLAELGRAAFGSAH